MLVCPTSCAPRSEIITSYFSGIGRKAPVGNAMLLANSPSWRAPGEIANDTIKNDFRNIDPPDSQILITARSGRIRPTYPPYLSPKTTLSLNKLGVTVQTNSVVPDIQSDALTVKRGETLERIPCRPVIWAADAQASILRRRIAEATGAQVDHAGSQQPCDG